MSAGVLSGSWVLSCPKRFTPFAQDAGNTCRSPVEPWYRALTMNEGASASLLLTPYPCQRRSAAGFRRTRYPLLCSASHFLPVNRATSRFLCAESTSPPYLMFRPPSALVAHFQLFGAFYVATSKPGSRGVASDRPSAGGEPCRYSNLR